MSFGADCLINKLNTNITGLGATNQTSLDFAQLGGALNSLENSFCSVATINDLPAACDNEGRFIYVTGCRSFRYSDGYEWLMNACSVSGNSLWSWGRNYCGSSGNGTTVSRCSPGKVFDSVSGSNWIKACTGVAQSVAIKTDGTLWTWGFNDGRLGDGTTVTRCSPGTVAGGGTTWCQVSTTNAHTTAIKTDGTLWTWGNNLQGQLGDGTAVSRCSPGTVWGSYTTWCQVSNGNSHSTALKTDGTLWTWGDNACGVLGDGTTVARCSPGTVAGGGTTWCRVSGGSVNSAAIKCDGTLWTWGRSVQGSLGDGTTLNRCSPGTTAGCGTNWCQISVYSYSAAIKTDGTLWTWGGNFCGSLGDGTTVSRSSPGTVAGGGTTWCLAANGLSFGTAIKTDGTLWTWGGNFCGSLGDGTTVDRCSPGTIAGGGTTWCQVSSAARNILALKLRGF